MLILVTGLAACSQSPGDKRKDAILSANFYLTKRQCDSAITVLEGAGRDTLDATYMRTLSSAYACKGGFDAIKLFSDDMELFGTPQPLGGSARFSTSDDMTTPTDTEYVNLQAAIDILLYAGSIGEDEEPTVDKRASLFNAQDAAEINMQLVYMMMVQIGRFMRFYGNASTAGVKGAGGGTNQCFIRYENVALSGTPASDLSGYFALGAGGACIQGNFTAVGQGHPGLGSIGSYNIERLCQGAVLINNFFNVFPAVLEDLAGNDFPWMTNLDTVITTAKSTMENALAGTTARVGNVQSQTNCESLNAADDNFIQVYYAIMMESLLQ